MEVSKRQLLRIIREEAEKAIADDAAAEEATPDEETDEKTDEETVSEARLRKYIRKALINESAVGLFGAIGFQGLGQTNHRNPGIGWGTDHAKKSNRRKPKQRGNKVQFTVLENAISNAEKMLGKKSVRNYLLSKLGL